MKFLSAILFAAGIIYGAHAAEEEQPTQDQTTKINYSVGYQIGSDFKHQEIEARPDAVLQGIQDAISGDKAQMSPAEMRSTMSDLGKHVAELKRKKRDQMMQQHIETNHNYLLENAKQEGVTTTASGLQYKVLTQGEGKSPAATDKVVVNYRGKLISGKEFDSSYQRGEPANFGVDQVIKGWTEALLLMKPGAKWQLVIPPDLAYGENGMGKSVPPHSTLIFEVELLSVFQ